MKGNGIYMIFNSGKSSVKALNELYFGKTKDIQKIEDQLDKVRQKYMGKINPFKVNSDPDVLELNRLFEKQFGFGTFCLTIISSPQINAFTIPISYRFDVSTGDKGGKLMADTSTFKFNPAYDYACTLTIYTGLLFNPNFTTEEIMACILHEIGHNFYSTLYQKNGVMINIYKVFAFIEYLINGNIVGMISGTNCFVDIQNKIRNAINTNPVASDIAGVMKYIGGIFNIFISGVGFIAKLLSFNLLYYVSLLGGNKKMLNPMTYVILPLRYRDERTADNFPTMYGYGSALASLTRKFDEAGNNTSKVVNALETVPVISTLYNMVPLPYMILVTALDEHPTGISRAQDQLTMLNVELAKSDLDPKMKKCIESDIKAINIEMNKSIDSTKGLSDPNLARHLYNRTLYELTGSEAIKDKLLDDKVKYEEYDKTFYRNLK
jgi:hypothetical protein